MADSSVRDMNINIGGLLVVVIVVLVFLFVWPGPFRYEYKVEGSFILRFDRIGSKVSTLSDGKYRTITDYSTGSVSMESND